MKVVFAILEDVLVSKGDRLEIGNHVVDDKANLMAKPHAKSEHAPLPPLHPFVHGSQVSDS